MPFVRARYGGTSVPNYDDGGQHFWPDAATTLEVGPRTAAQLARHELFVEVPPDMADPALSFTPVTEPGLRDATPPAAAAPPAASPVVEVPIVEEPAATPPEPVLEEEEPADDASEEEEPAGDDPAAPGTSRRRSSGSRKGRAARTA